MDRIVAADALISRAGGRIGVGRSAFGSVDLMSRDADPHDAHDPRTDAAARLREALAEVDPADQPAALRRLLAAAAVSGDPFARPPP
ncbi:MAG: hypothetical protein H0V93_06925, partial [Euzebyales bacterium]|nr:hypothetical protein [Euzebyales bacterium]